MPRRRQRPRLVRAIALVLAVQVGAGLGGALVLHEQHEAPARSAPTRARVLPRLDLGAARETAVRALLDARASAMSTRDRAAWLATVDPTATAFRERQGELFDALAEVPIRDWHYRVDPSSTPPDVDLDATRGPGWWAPGVTLSYRIEGYDAVPTLEPQRLTFVPRGGTWFVAADDDFAAAGEDTTRGLWDSGHVIVERGRRSIVLGHVGSRSLMRRVASSLDAAVPRVTDVWGTGWAERVVALLPSTQAELIRVVGGTGDYSQIAAVATAELTDANAGYHPVGDRIVINPPNFAKLGRLGRRVVLTHEVTHVATRTASGPVTPVWLVEGLADYVGYRGLAVPYSLSATELRDAVRRGHVPAALPSDADFDGSNAHLAEAYEQAWLAVSLLAAQHGRDDVLRLYRMVGRPGAPPTAVEDAFAQLWGTDVATFTGQWHAYLIDQLG